MQPHPHTSQGLKPSLKEQFVPLEQRESQKIGLKHYLKETATFLGITALGAAIGFAAGKALEPRNISLGSYGRFFHPTGKLDGKLGGAIGGKIGGIYALYNHWRKREGKRLGVSNISSDLNAVLSAEYLQQETQKEQAIVEGLQRLQSARPSHVQTLTAEREQEAAASGITTGVSR